MTRSESPFRDHGFPRSREPECFPPALCFAAILAAVFAGCSPKSASENPSNASSESANPAPNVLFIVWDTVRADHLGCYGYTAPPTSPHLDRFAESALLFENAVSPGMWTVPTHASLFTGLPVSTHGAYFGHKWLDDEFDTLAEIFRDAGYATYFFSANPHVSDEDNFTQGFDRQDFAWTEPWVSKIHVTMRPKLHPQDRSNERFQKINDARPAGLAQFDIPTSESKDAGLVINDTFLNWVDEQPKEKPFFAFLNYMEAHYPRLPSMEARRKIMTEEQITRSLAIDQSNERLIAYMFGLEKLSPEEIEVVADVYDATLIDLDAITDQLFQALAERELLDNTIIVLTSDHGENLGDHGMMMHRYCLYNSLTRVPLLIRYPKRVPAGREPRPVSTAHVFGTLLDLAGVENRNNAANLLTAETDASVPVISELVAPALRIIRRFVKLYPEFDRRPWLRAYRSIEITPYRFIWSSDNQHELYDMSTDPNETKNLVEALPERAAELKAQLDTWYKTVEKYDPNARPAPNSRPPSPEMIERLKALGYVE